MRKEFRIKPKRRAKRLLASWRSRDVLSVEKSRSNGTKARPKGESETPEQRESTDAIFLASEIENSEIRNSN